MILKGRFVGDRAAEAFRATVQIVLESGVAELIVDLREVRAIDSTGLGELIAAQANARAGGGILELLPSPQVDGILQRPVSLRALLSQLLCQIAPSGIRSGPRANWRCIAAQVV